MLTNHVLVTPLPDPSSYWCPVLAFLMSSETNNRGMVRAKFLKIILKDCFLCLCYNECNNIFSKTSILVYIISMWHGIPKDWFSCLCYNECDMIFSKTGLHAYNEWDKIFSKTSFHVYVIMNVIWYSQRLVYMPIMNEIRYSQRLVFMSVL